MREICRCLMFGYAHYRSRGCVGASEPSAPLDKAQGDTLTELCLKHAETLWTAVSKLESQICRNPDLPPVYREIMSEAFEALREIDKVARRLRFQPMHQSSTCVHCQSGDMPVNGRHYLDGTDDRYDECSGVAAPIPSEPPTLIGDTIREMINAKTTSSTWADGELEHLRDTLDSLLESVSVACDPTCTALLAMACEEISKDAAASPKPEGPPEHQHAYHLGNPKCFVCGEIDQSQQPAERPEGGEPNAQQVAMNAWQVLGALWGIKQDVEQQRISNWFWAIAHREKTEPLFPLKLGASPVPSAALPTCPCCKSEKVTLERNEISRWVQCHNPRCGLTHHVSMHPELAAFFSPQASTAPTCPNLHHLAHELAKYLAKEYHWPDERRWNAEELLHKALAAFFSPQASATVDIVNTLTNACQVFDGWHNDGTAWSEWDESVRQDLSKLLAYFQEGKCSTR